MSGITASAYDRPEFPDGQSAAPLHGSRSSTSKKTASRRKLTSIRGVADQACPNKILARAQSMIPDSWLVFYHIYLPRFPSRKMNSFFSKSL
jgi:hypothetical protein